MGEKNCTKCGLREVKYLGQKCQHEDCPMGRFFREGKKAEPAAKTDKPNPLDAIRTPGKLLPKGPLVEVAALLARKSSKREMGDITAISAKYNAEDGKWSVTGKTEPDKAEAACYIGQVNQPPLMSGKPEEKPKPPTSTKPGDREFYVRGLRTEFEVEMRKIGKATLPPKLKREVVAAEKPVDGKPYTAQEVAEAYALAQRNVREME